MHIGSVRLHLVKKFPTFAMAPAAFCQTCLPDTQFAAMIFHFWEGTCACLLLLIPGMCDYGVPRQGSSKGSEKF
jgi:hypothetical protein